MRKKRAAILLAVFLSLFFSLCCATAALLATPPEEGLLASAYGGGERLRYRVSWLGIPAGELEMAVRRLDGHPERFALEVVAKSAGLLAVFYPVEDRFLTVVEGKNRLPVRHEMEQREGRRRNRRLTLYDQEAFRVTHQKNDDPPENYQLDGPAHNEFSSFFLLRVLPLRKEGELVVPTFADRKRHEVKVSFLGEEEAETLFGTQRLLKARPHLKFKGLYEKVGDPLVWLTADALRIPARIEARIVIGSLTAELVEYSGPALSAVLREKRPVSPEPPPDHSD